jgi:hypothetical protein
VVQALHVILAKLKARASIVRLVHALRVVVVVRQSLVVRFALARSRASSSSSSSSSSSFVRVDRLGLVARPRALARASRARAPW